jgi:hypothetical protein
MLWPGVAGCQLGARLARPGVTVPTLSIRAVSGTALAGAAFSGVRCLALLASQAGK